MGWQDEGRARMKAGKKDKFTFEEGLNTFRILPNKNATKNGSGGFADESPMVELYQHKDVGPNKRMVVCGRDWQREGKCWICDSLIPKLEASGKRSKIALANSIRRQRVWMAQVIYLDQITKKWIGPVLWYVPGSGTEKSFSGRLYKRLSRKAYYDPAKGYNLTVERTGMGMNTEYGEIEADDEPTKLNSKYLEALKPFSAVMPAYVKDQQLAAWEGRDWRPDNVVEDDDESEDDDTVDDEDLDSEDSDDDDEDAPKKSKSKSTDKKKSKPVEDDDEDLDDEDADTDDDESEDDDDDDEDDAPPSKAAKKGKPAPTKGKVEDDDEDEADLDEDEDDEPSKKKGPVKSEKSKTAPKKKKGVEELEVEDDDEDEDSDDEDEVDLDDDEDLDDDPGEDDEENDDDADDEDDDPPPTKKGAPVKKAPPVPVKAPKKGKK